MSANDTLAHKRAAIRARLTAMLAELDALSENLAATHVNSALEAMRPAPPEPRAGKHLH